MSREQELAQNIAQSVRATARAYDAVRLALQGEDRVHQLMLVDDLLAAVEREIAMRSMER
jgi:hypothetical protein